MSWDDEEGFEMLFTPDMDNTDNHCHVELSDNQAMQLALFLNKKLEEIRLGTPVQPLEQANRGNWENARKFLEMGSDLEPEPEDRL